MGKDRARDFDPNRLCDAMHRARLALRYFREKRKEAVRQLVGRHWSEEGTAESVPLNLVQQYVSVVGRQLVAKNPRVLLSTFDRAHKPAVKACEDWANREIVSMRLDNTLQRVVIDALFSLGVCKVALAAPPDSSRVAWNLPSGQPFAERVDLDDFVFDVHARDFSEASFEGHRYRVPLEVARSWKGFGKGRKDLTASEDRLYNLEGDERISVLGRSVYATNADEFEDMVDLWEVYLPRHRLVVTLADDDLTGPAASRDGPKVEPLRVQPWLGPESGPYHFLGYGVVPGNAMPLAPMQNLLDLHLASNNILRKLIDQARRQKQNTWVQGGATEDGERVINSNDGEAIRVDNPEKIHQTDSGGPNQQIALLLQTLTEFFSQQGGNLRMLGGTAAESRTATQDEMLNKNASAQLADMQSTTIDFASDVVKSLCWYWWHHPEKVMESEYTPPGVPGVSITRKVDPGRRRQLPWDRLDIRVDPYSLQHVTPQMRANDLVQITTQVIIPMMGVLQQQGVGFDANAFLALMAQLKDMPDLQQIVTIQEPPDQSGGEGGAGPGGAAAPRPATTTREYTRRSVAGGPNERRADLVKQLMAGAARNGSANGTG